MALPTSQELQSLIAELTAAAQSYTATLDLSGYMSRVAIIAKAKSLTQALVSPEQLPNYHGLNVCFSHLASWLTGQMAELVAIRTFMKLKVLDAIPTSGSISLSDISKKTGAQESLIGKGRDNIDDSNLTDIERMGRVLGRLWTRLVVAPIDLWSRNRFPRPNTPRRRWLHAHQVFPVLYHICSQSWTSVPSDVSYFKSPSLILIL